MSERVDFGVMGYPYIVTDVYSPPVIQVASEINDRVSSYSEFTDMEELAISM